MHCQEHLVAGNDMQEHKNVGSSNEPLGCAQRDQNVGLLHQHPGPQLPKHDHNPFDNGSMRDGPDALVDNLN